MTTIGLSYSLVKISTKCAPALIFMEGMKRLIWHDKGAEYRGQGGV